MYCFCPQYARYGRVSPGYTDGRCNRCGGTMPPIRIDYDCLNSAPPTSTIPVFTQKDTEPFWERLKEMVKDWKGPQIVIGGPMPGPRSVDMIFSLPKPPPQKDLKFTVVKKRKI